MLPKVCTIVNISIGKGEWSKYDSIDLLKQGFLHTDGGKFHNDVKHLKT